MHGHSLVELEIWLTESGIYICIFICTPLRVGYIFSPNGFSIQLCTIPCE